MNPLSIIYEKASNEGFPVSRELVAKVAVEDVQLGVDVAFAYPGGVVFTVGVHSAIVHLYSTGDGASLLAAARKFHRDCWSVGHQTLYAPILNAHLARVAGKMGWEWCSVLVTGHDVYKLERAKQ
jgi:hypothetical protein